MKTISLQTSRQVEFIDITGLIRKEVQAANCQEGICFLYVPHTTAGLMINEKADPDVIRDIDQILEKIIPLKGNYFHKEGNAHAHIKASVLGCTAFIFIKDGKPVLGTWQGVFFCEFDGPRRRSIYLKIMQEIGP
ncbi:MAG: secondary thiamine-phosphate synthase enzyme YjbQ [Bacillota bacterium]|nr:secondary thiamine-phosphate synthase enzyme YjbQ [Bacillota bacterium]